MTKLRQQAYSLLDAIPEEKLFLIIDILREVRRDENQTHDTASDDLMEAITDSRMRRNLHGPFTSAREAVASMLEE